MQREPRTEEAPPRSRLRRVDGIEEIPIDTLSSVSSEEARRQVELLVPLLPFVVGMIGGKFG